MCGIILNMKDFTFIDLFAGIGGIRIALEDIGGNCVFSSEIEKHCQKTYKENFGETPKGDIKEIDPASIPDHNILAAGFPCQPFSISGKKKGFEDTRGTLFFYIMRVIQEKKPDVVFLENVKHMIYHDKKRTLQTILRSLEEEGYYVSWKVLNAKDFALPQNRERLIIIASRDWKFDFAKVKSSDKAVLIRDILEEDSEEYEYLEPDEYTILEEKMWRKQSSGLIFCGYRNKKIRQNGVRKNTTHLSRVHKQPNRIYHIDGTHPTIPSQETSGRFWIYNGDSVRKLTMTECFRLMGFPEDYKKISSKTELYKQIGNSVPINLIESVGLAVKECMFATNLEQGTRYIKDNKIGKQLNLMEENYA
jgi:DNA (cytosine-5)-methyltransferase 1